MGHKLTNRHKRRPVVRRSISISAEVDKKIRSIAHANRSSANRVLEDLIDTGLTAKEAEKRRFLEMAERYRNASDPREVSDLKRKLSKAIFGE